MKLTKNTLITATKSGLNELGYQEVKDTVTGAQGLYIKTVKPDFYLTLGLTISRYYNSVFTGSFYLSKTTIWSAVWGDIPKNSYQRIGHFLNDDERRNLLDHEHSQETVKDAWWNTNDTNAINCFLEAVRISEERFLNQVNLFHDVEKSLDVNELRSLARFVVLSVETAGPDKFEYQYLPGKPVDNVPLDWFKTAERVIRSSKGAILNINTVKRLAVDAYRQKLLSDS